MGFFECCRICPESKRHLGCHSDCPDYIKDKQALDNQKELKRKESMFAPAKTDYLIRPVWHDKR